MPAAGRTSWLRWLLGYEGIPLMSRPTFRYDFLSSLFLALGLSAMVPELTQLFARKSLEAHPSLVAIPLTEIAVGNFIGAILSQYLARRRRVACVVAARVGMAVLLAAIALLPVGPRSALPYVALLFGPAVLAAVSLNVTTAVRHGNYPAGVRGRIFSRLAVVHMAGIAASVRLAGAALDAWDWAHRLIYVTAAAMLLLSAYLFRRIRVRNERSMLRAEAGRRVHLLSGFRVLVHDRVYRTFMLWQFISGSTVMMTVPVMALLMTDYLKVDYSRGATALALVPLCVAIVANPLTGRVFDHVRVTRFRAVSAALWASSRALIFLGALTGSWAVVLVGFAVQGMGLSMGHMAFNMAHTYFAPPDRSQQYMGVHMALQGLRGLIVPSLGAALYALTDLGIAVIPIAAGVQFVAAGGFFLMRPPPAHAGRPHASPARGKDL
jgi:hypothetical protein